MTAVEVPVSRGFVSVIDAADADLVLGMGTWTAVVAPRTTYAGRYVRENGRRRFVYMHHVITGWRYVDHRDGDGLNNRRTNLRRASHGQNMRNQRLRQDNTSGYKGVTWRADGGRWRAQITIDGRVTVLGRFDDPTEAARAYDEAALAHYGEFARVNFPEARR